MHNRGKGNSGMSLEDRENNDYYYYYYYYYYCQIKETEVGSIQGTGKKCKGKVIPLQARCGPQGG